MKTKLTFVVVLATVIFFLLPNNTFSQTCFTYVETENAKTPVRCVQKGDLSTTCTCAAGGNNSCTNDCTAIPASSPQSIREMHIEWHECFGSIGGTNPFPGRSQRWFAFHRQFEYDFNLWRDGIGFSNIESLEWCPDMNMPYGHPSADPAGIGHPDDCGTGNPRPNNVACNDCVAFPECLFFSGAGPESCLAGSSSECPTGVSALEDFDNIDDLAAVMDDYFHGAMHGAVGDADGNDYIDDITNPDCSPRDPMFWRGHKALDDVMRAWQDHKAVDIIIVVDRSGSMDDPAVSGATSTKLDAALEAAEMFADMMDINRADGQQNRIGIVSYSGSARLDMPLTVANTSLLNSGGALQTALDDIRNTGANGCTGIGPAIEKALEELCPAGDCRGVSDRKAILLLTDGFENRPPCIQAAGGSGSPSCGTQCFGAQLDYDLMESTQLVGVGFGQSGSLNGEMLTLLTERQGGIYMQNPNASPGDDMKYFFSIAFGQLTDEFIFSDPRGILPANQSITEPVPYNSCQDGKITFSSGWNSPVKKGGMQLIVTDPSGGIVDLNDPNIQASEKKSYAYARIRMPHNGNSSGNWTAQLMRPHRQFVNGFTTDCFADVKKGIALVRRQIQRLCPTGCNNVLYFEDGRLGDQSVYEEAIKIEQSTGLLKNVKQTNDASDFAQLLDQPWDLIVYAHQMDEKGEPYDDKLTSLMCRGQQKAILTDTRPNVLSSGFLECLAFTSNSTKNFNSISGDGRLLAGTLKLKNPGHKIMSYTLGNETGDVQAFAKANKAAIISTFDKGVEQYWFINVLGKGLSKISSHSYKYFWQTGEDLVATARVLPSYYIAGGYDEVKARVIVEHPLVSIGKAIKNKWLGNIIETNGEILDARAAAMRNVKIPTKLDTFLLYDDGTHGDELKNNHNWSSILRGIGEIDGMYRMRYVFDFIKDGCAVTRELSRSVFVEIGIDPKSSGLDVGRSRPNGNNLITPVTILPKDVFGNIWGPGRLDFPVCAVKQECQVDASSIKDNEDGSYTIDLNTPKDVAGVRLDVFGNTFDIPLTCDNCPELIGFEISSVKIDENKQATGKIKLNGPAPKAGLGGAVIYLSTDNKLTLHLPSVVIVPEGESEATFLFTSSHVHDDPIPVKITATYGNKNLSETITVMPHNHHMDDDNDDDDDDDRKLPDWLNILCIASMAILFLLLIWWVLRKK